MSVEIAKELETALNEAVGKASLGLFMVSVVWDQYDEDDRDDDDDYDEEPFGSEDFWYFITLRSKLKSYPYIDSVDFQTPEEVIHYVKRNWIPTSTLNLLDPNFTGTPPTIDWPRGTETSATSAST